MSHLLSSETDESPVELLRTRNDRVDNRSIRVPAPLNALIGREQECAAVGRLLERDDVRLITLTGPGGVGKTRLALAVAATAEETFEGGVIFVPLAPVRDVALVSAAIADRLDVQRSGDRPLVEDLMAHLRGHRILLILDNFEHVLDAAPLVSELLRACPGLKVLATSRRRLGLSGEHETSVPPLAVADPNESLTVDQLAAVPAIQLFVARAQAAAPSFMLNEANGRQIAGVCLRLDGLPLAIELAAPRTRILSPGALLLRLTNRLQLLTDGPRDVPERLQTMRRAIDWSHDLLDPEVQRLFRRLAVFVGGFTLEAADWMSVSPLSDTLDLVAALLDESLLQTIEQPDGERRFGMLETVREYALERLHEAGEEAAARRLHAEYCLQLVERDDSGQYMPQDWLERQQAEHDNHRTALVWSIARDPETALRLADALWRFWSQRGYWSEGRVWLEQALAAALHAAPALRAAASAAAGALADDQGDFLQARRSFEASLELAQQVGDEHRAARALRSLGIVASNQNELDCAAELFAVALARLRPLHDQAAIGRCLNDLGLVADRQGHHDRAIVYYEEALAFARATNEPTFAALVLSNLGAAFIAAGDFARGEALTEEALDQSRMLGDQYGIAINFYNLAACIEHRGDLAGAWERYRESLVITDELGDRKLVSRILDHLAHLLTVSDRTRLAARLLGAASAIRQATGDALFPSEEEVVARTAAATRAALGEESFQAAWDVGASLSPEQAVAETLTIAPPPRMADERATLRALDLGLTARELEVLRLVAAGWADKEIAAALAISRHTASKHVAAVRAKLDAPSRTGAVAAAREAGIL